MKFIKEFESFDFNQTLPITTKNYLTNYYSCDECDCVWKEFNEESSQCKHCGSNEIENLQEEEWFEIAKARLDEDELKDLERQRSEESDTFIDILSTKKNLNDGN